MAKSWNYYLLCLSIITTIFFSKRKVETLQPQQTMKKRPIYHLILVLAVILLGTFIYQLNLGEISERVSLTIEGQMKQNPRSILVTSTVPGGFSGGFVKYHNRNYWYTDGWVTKLLIHFPKSFFTELKGVEVTVGDRRFHFTKEEILEKWEKVEVIDLKEENDQLIIVAVPSEVRFEHSLVPGLSTRINWPGDKKAVVLILKNSFFSILLLIIALFACYTLLQKGYIKNLLENVLITDNLEEHHISDVSPFYKNWVILGLGLLIGCLIMLELRQPYYFTQDDNFAQFLPTILQGCRSLEAGVFSNWNPYQFMGVPTSNVGIYALTYPITYLSFFVAKYIFRNEYFTIEIFSIFHLIAGYLLIYRAGRLLDLRQSLATISSLSFILSGYMLIAGRSWYYMSPVAIWMPLLIILIIKLQKEHITWRWAFSLGIITGMFFHAGNAQMWAYALMFFCIAVMLLVWTKVVPISRAAWAVPGLLIGLAIACPLLIPQMLISSDLVRGGWTGQGIVQDFFSLLFPYPISRTTNKYLWGSTNYFLMGHLYYSGTVLCTVGLVTLSSIIAYRWPKNVLAANLWLICAAIALVLALGDRGLLWTVHSVLPVFKKFTFPFKFIPFFNLFIILGSALVLERYLYRIKNHQLYEKRIVGLALILIIYNCFLALPSFYTYGDKPYPSLPPQISETIKSVPDSTPQRIFSFAPRRSVATDYTISLCQNFASLYGVYAINGYQGGIDSMLPQNLEADKLILTDPVNALRAYGVRWLLISPLVNKPQFGPNPNIQSSDTINREQAILLQMLKPHTSKRVEVNGLTLLELQGSSPLAFYESSPQEAIPVHFHGGGADLTQITYAGPIILNVLWRPGIVTMADGKLLENQKDSWGRVRFDVPAGSKHIAIKFSPPWNKAFMAGLILLIVGVTFIFLLNALNKASQKLPTMISQEEPKLTTIQ
jgi:hypothetical protein